LTKNEFEKLKKLKNYQLSPAGNYGFKKAEVTKGGIKIDKIDPKTLQSKLQKGLYFMGECLDVTGELGGYNLHFAFSCAKRINLYKS
jgi:predicted flavoprotein YhiN